MARADFVGECEGVPGEREVRGHDTRRVLGGQARGPRGRAGRGEEERYEGRPTEAITSVRGVLPGLQAFLT
jgi:hypothetical protein